MKRVFIILIIFATSTALATGQTVDQETAASVKNKRDVMKVERRWHSAFQKRNIRVLRGILANDFVGTTSAGDVQNKKEELADLKATAPKFVSFNDHEVEVQVYGDLGIVTGRESLTVLYEGLEVSGEFLYTRIYVERRGHWQLVVLHTSKVEK